MHGVVIEQTAAPQWVFPLDVHSLEEARTWTRRMHRYVDVFKVGLELFCAEGPGVVALVRETGRPCFLDLKLHDIPATVEKAVASVARLDAAYLTVHALGGEAMMRAACASAGATRILAVTVLTSHGASNLPFAADGDNLGGDDLGCDDLGCDDLGGDNIARWVQHFAGLGLASGVDGFVASPWECAALRAQVDAHAAATKVGVKGADAGAAGGAGRVSVGPKVLVVPGVRPEGSGHQDQKRVATPSEAVMAGADLIVCGRPVREAADPEGAAVALRQEIDAAWTSAQELPRPPRGAPLRDRARDRRGEG